MMTDHYNSHDNTEFLTCDLKKCRPGVRDALLGTLRLIEAGQKTISVLIAPRYGKSNFMRQLSVELTERRISGACLILEPWVFLRGQINDNKKLGDMRTEHGINGARIRPKAITPDILSGKVDPAFYAATPPRHWWSLTMSQAYTEQTKSVLRDLAAQFNEEKRPLVVFIDECHLTSVSEHGWGKLAKELKEAGAVLLLLTGTPERSDNIAPFGFQTEEISREDIQYTTRSKISDEKTLIEYYDAQRVRYKILPDVPAVSLKQAWDEKAICQLQVRYITFDADGKNIEEVKKNKASRSLWEAVRDQETIRAGVRLMLDELRLRRQTEGKHGSSNPNTGGIVLVGNDRRDDEGNDWHARQAKRILEQEWNDYFPNAKPKIQIVTRNTEEEDSDRAAKTIKSFVEGDGDIIVVKMMGGVGLDAPRLKVGLDLSTIRTKSNATQRWLRLCTMLKGVANGTWILPNDPITVQLWKNIVEEQGGQYGIENRNLLHAEIIDCGESDPEPHPVISDPRRAGSIDTSLRFVEDGIDQKLDAIVAKAPLLAIRFTRSELADMYEKGMFADVEVNIGNPEAVGIYNAEDEVKKKVDTINFHCKKLANREISYMGAGDPENSEAWVNVFRRVMSSAKGIAGIRGELKVCRDIEKLAAAEDWLEQQIRLSE